MAIVFAESFEYYGTDETNMLDGLWGELNQNTALVSDGSARTGSYYLQTGGASGVGVLKRSFGQQSTVGIAFGWRFPALPASANRAGFTLSTLDGTDVISVIVQTDGTIQVKSGTMSGTLIDTASQAIVAGSWYHIEVKVVISSTVGSVEVRLNGVSVLSASDLNLGTAQVSLIEFDTGGTTQSSDIDDMVVWNGDGGWANDFLGPVRVVTVYPTGDAGSPADWTVSGAVNGYEAIDDTSPDDDTTTIGAPNVGDESAFTVGSLPSNVVTIEGFYVPTRMKQDDPGTTTVVVSAISNGVTDVGDEVNLTTSYQYWGQAFGLNPDTAQKYTKSEFEAVQLHIERTA